MAVQIPGTTPRILDGGLTGSQAAAGFVTVQTAGAREFARELLKLANRAGKDATAPLTAAAKAAAKPVMEAYKKNIKPDVTGNLRRAIAIRQGKNKYEGVGIAVAGPLHVVSGGEWDVEKKAAGNHAWLVEFGTGRRTVGTQNRRTYLNVHQRINGQMHRVPNAGRPFNNEQFKKMGRGYYFLMGSSNEQHPERRTGRGAFVKKPDGSTRPYTLGPGDTYGAMPAKHAMQKAIQAASPQAQAVLIAEIKKHMKAFK